jgi:hypothetical protein
MRPPLRNRFGRNMLAGTTPANPAPMTNQSQLSQLQAQLAVLNAQFAQNSPSANYADAFFAYVASFGSLAPVTTAQVALVIQSDSDFEWLKTSYYTNKDGATTPIPSDVDVPLSIQITDSGNGQQIFSAPTPYQTVAGRSGLPFVNPVSRLFVANSTIQLVTTNFDAADTYDNITFVLLGRKIWKFS